MKERWHQYSIVEIKNILKTDIYKGLLDIEVAARRKEYGRNTFTENARPTFFSVVANQFKSPLVLVLFIAGITTVLLGEYVDAVVIAVALLINVSIGTIQEERASKAFSSLKKSQQKFATVVRNGAHKIIPAENLVPGDIILVEQGMIVPADARIIDANELSTNESSLTGEWIDVEKDANATVKKDTPVTDQANMLWMGTVVTSGIGRAVVVATGDKTHMGTIAGDLLTPIHSFTPLQKNIRRLSFYLTVFIIFTICIILVLGYVRGEKFIEIFLIAVAIAVAAMPEGLPAAVAVVLALGMESIFKKRGLVRNMLAAETLGSTTFILTDKTGTLTKATMEVAEIITFSYIKKEKGIDRADILVQDKDPQDVLAMAVLSSDAFVEGFNDSLSEWVVRGKPMEKAITKAGLELGIRKERLEESAIPFDSIPFESERKFTASLNGGMDRNINRVYIKGAPEILLEKSDFIYHNGSIMKMTAHNRKRFEEKLQEKTMEGLRVLGVAFKDVSFKKFSIEDRGNAEHLLSAIVFAGFIVIHDPIRADAKNSIKEAKDAGVKVVMVTGDNVYTAKKIAEEVGISFASDHAMEGKDIMQMNDQELLGALKKMAIFARVTPRQKMRLVQVLKNSGEVVAMTGDGINDAPALRRADIGIALGSGTDVAKEASDLIILDDNFSVIISAIEEGRRIMDNLKKIIAYLLSTSFGEVIVVGSALAAGAPIPLLPAQILWTNIVEEGFMNFSFAFEPREEGIMKRNPRASIIQSIFTKQLRFMIITLSVVSGIFMTAIYFILLKTNLPIENIRTIMFIILSADSIFFSISLKDLNKPIWRIHIFSNLYLLAAIAMSLSVLFVAIMIPPLRNLLSLSPATPLMVTGGILAGIANLLIIETIKFIYYSSGIFRNKRKIDRKSGKMGKIMVS